MDFTEKVQTVTYIPELFEVLQNFDTGKVIVYYSAEICGEDKLILETSLAKRGLTKCVSREDHSDVVADEYPHGFFREVWQ